MEIQTTDTAEVRAGPALIDSGATGLFMSQGYVEHHRLITQKLQCPIAVYNIDGSLNEARSITEMVDAILHVNRHSERTNFTVTNLSKQNLTLGFTWLQKHNPEIDWQTQKVTMTQCPDKCHTFQVEIHNERRTIQKEEHQIQVYRAGPLLRFAKDDLELGEEGLVWEAMHEDELLDSEDIRASQMTSQRLAEENHK